MTKIDKTLSVPATAAAPIYPKLCGARDFGLFRVAGAGLGNCLYSYFHAYILARETGAPLIHPAWVSLKLGPLLRGERSKRFYIGLFRAPPGEIHGWRKLLALGRGLLGRPVPLAVDPACVATARPALVMLTCRTFGFGAFRAWRDEIRARFAAMIRRTAPIRWGAGEHIGAHIRLGDFAAAKPGQLESGKVNNLRIPLEWYENVLRRLRAEFPDSPIHIFSDGHETELAQVLAIDGVTLRREPDDVSDLLAIAESRILVGSHSTFSRWGAFLGDMPSIWLLSEQIPEQPTAAGTPLLYVGSDTSGITRAALGLA